MLSAGNISAIKDRVCDFWQEQIRNAHFAEQIKGKEAGHRIADYVDDKTTAFIHAHYPVAFERNSAGKKKPRSMGDLWLKENNIYHPVNIKTGLTNSGQPNMVSLKKLLTGLLQNQIDSYYLVMVKFTLTSEELQTPEVYFIDMLEYLDYVTFDSGPGQIMLQAESFYENFHAPAVASRTLPGKVDFLLKLLEDGDRRLFANRKTRFKAMQKLAKQYNKKGIFAVSSDTQEPFNFGQ